MDTKRQRIIEIIAEVFDVPKDFYKLRNQKRKYVYPKKALVLVLYGKEEMTFADIAKFLSYSTHNTAMHHFEDGNNLWDTSESFQEKMNFIMDKARQIYYNQ